jgi:hypothetical protein
MIVDDRRKKKWFWAENDIIDREDLSSLEKMAYLALCRYADNDTNSCFPSHATLAKKVGCSRRKIIDIVKSLKTKGLINIFHRTSEQGDPTSNLYVIFSPKATEGKEVVQENHYPVHDLHHRDVAETLGVVHSIPTNNTYSEPPSATTTTTQTESVVVTDEIEEELKKSISLTPFETLYPFSMENIQHIGNRAYFACNVLDVYAHQYKSGWRPNLPEAVFRNALTKGEIFYPLNYVPLAERVRMLKKEARKRPKEEIQRWSLPDEEIRSAVKQIAAL